jgi:hypothetical protein
MPFNGITRLAVNDFYLAPSHQRSLLRCLLSLEKSIAFKK